MLHVFPLYIFVSHSQLCPHPRVHQTLSPVFVTWQGDGCVLSTVSGQLTFTCGFFLESWLEIPGFHGFVFLTFSLIFTEHPAFALLPLCVRPTSVLWRGLTTCSWNQVQPSWNHDIFFTVIRILYLSSSLTQFVTGINCISLGNSRIFFFFLNLAQYNLGNLRNLK